MESCQKHPLTHDTMYDKLPKVVRVVEQDKENIVRKAKLDETERKGEIVLTENESKLIQLLRNHPYPEKAISATIETILRYLKQH